MPGAGCGGHTVWTRREASGRCEGGEKREETPKVRKAEREAGHQLETATICSVALGLRSGWAGRPGDRVRSPARCPRPPG